MSFNLAIAAGVSSASLHALSDAALEPAGGSSAGGSSAMWIDDVPLCGTPVPGHPPLPHGLGSLLDRVALNPQPLPPAAAGATLAGGKFAAYDDVDWCGTVPHKLHFPPPPPPGPWTDIVNGALGMGG